MPFLKSTIALKVVMAVTGLILVGFVCAHMAGNLQAWVGAEMFNDYAKKLRIIPELLWGMRIVLFLSVIAHVGSIVELARRTEAARPVGYAAPAVHASPISARTMKISGVLLFAFVPYHLMHMTIGNIHPDFIAGDAFHNLVAGFQNPIVVFAYCVAMGALGLHVHHGFQSAFQSIGFNHPNWNPWRDRLTVAIPAIVVLGFITIPLAILVGIIA